MKRGAVPGLCAAALLAGLAAADSTLVWKRTWTSPGNRDDVAEAVAVDAAGNAWVAGWSFRSDLSESVNAIVQKYSPDGALLWTRTHNGYPDAVDAAFGIAVDAYGYGYVAGSVSVTGGSSDGWLRKLAPDGSDVWTVTYDSPAGDQDVFRAVTVDPATGTIYVAGCERRADLLQEGNGLIAAFTAAGAPLWATSFDGGAGLWDEALGVCVAPGGDVVVAGYAAMEDPAGRLDRNIFNRLKVLLDETDGMVDTSVVVRRFTAAGGPVWERRYDAGEPDHECMDWARGVLADATGVYVAATIESIEPKDFNRWVRKYSVDGLSVLWTRELWRSTDPSPLDLAGTPGWGGPSRVLVPGSSSLSDLQLADDMTVDHLDAANGAPARSDAHGAGLVLNDGATAVAGMPGGGFVLAGWENRSDLSQRRNFVVIRYADPVPAAGVPLTAPVVWPNPFRPAAGGTLKFGGLPPGARIRIWTPAGRLVAEPAATGATAVWDGRAGDGRPVRPGLYWFLIEADGAATAKGSLVVAGPP